MAFQVTEPARDLLAGYTTQTVLVTFHDGTTRVERLAYPSMDGAVRLVRMAFGITAASVEPAPEFLPAHPASVAGESAAAPSAACGVPVDPCPAGTPSTSEVAA